MRRIRLSGRARLGLRQPLIYGARFCVLCPMSFRAEKFLFGAKTGVFILYTMFLSFCAEPFSHFFERTLSFGVRELCLERITFGDDFKKFS